MRAFSSNGHEANPDGAGIVEVSRSAASLRRIKITVFLRVLDQFVLSIFKLMPPNLTKGVHRPIKPLVRARI